MTPPPDPQPAGPERLVAAAREFARAMQEAAIPAGRKMAAFVKATRDANTKARVQP